MTQQDEMAAKQASVDSAAAILLEAMHERTLNECRRKEIVTWQREVEDESRKVRQETLERIADREEEPVAKLTRRLGELLLKSKLQDQGLQYFDLYPGANGERACLAAELALRRATYDAELARRNNHKDTVLERLASVTAIAGELQLSDGLGAVAAAHEQLVVKADLAVQEAARNLELHDANVKTARQEFDAKQKEISE